MSRLETVCRVCLETFKKSFDLYTDICLESKLSYSEMLMMCTKMKPKETDSLPRKICINCCESLKQTFVFNTQCEESIRVLKLYLENFSENLERLKYEIDIKPEVSTGEETEGIENLKHESPNIELDNDYWEAEDDNLVLGDLLVLKKVQEEKSKKSHQCDICGKFFSTKSNLKQHKLCHTELRPYKCVQCPASFRGNSGLFQHKKMHSGEKSYHCEYCSKQFGRRSGLISHIKIHTGDKQFSCSVCYKTFVQNSQLNTHMKRHQGLKPYLCQVCGKGFPIKAELVVHSRVHNGEKPYSCHLCSKTFATSGNLSIHVRIHNKEIRYHCRECKRGFVTCSAYNVHIKRHKGQKDYLCECGKTFYTSSSLKQHRVVHTGEKKYQCKMCNGQFTQSSHLTRHFKKVHSKPNIPLPPTKDFKNIVIENHLLEPLLKATSVES